MQGEWEPPGFRAHMKALSVEVDVCHQGPGVSSLNAALVAHAFSKGPINSSKASLLLGDCTHSAPFVVCESHVLKLFLPWLTPMQLNIGSNSLVVLPDKGAAQQHVRDCMMSGQYSPDRKTWMWAELGVMSVGWLWSQSEQQHNLLLGFVYEQLGEMYVSIQEDIESFVCSTTIRSTVGLHHDNERACSSCSQTGFCFMLLGVGQSSHHWKCRHCFRKSKLKCGAIESVLPNQFREEGE